jgi:hypothetical protein
LELFWAKFQFPVFMSFWCCLIFVKGVLCSRMDLRPFYVNLIRSSSSRSL